MLRKYLVGFIKKLKISSLSYFLRVVKLANFAVFLFPQILTGLELPQGCYTPELFEQLNKMSAYSLCPVTNLCVVLIRKVLNFWMENYSVVSLSAAKFCF